MFITVYTIMCDHIVCLCMCVHVCSEYVYVHVCLYDLVYIDVHVTDYTCTCRITVFIVYTLLQSQSPSDAENLLSPGGTKPSTFAAEYWGSLEVSQERLVKGKSVQVVLACMKELFGETPPEEMKLSGGLSRVRYNYKSRGF